MKFNVIIKNILLFLVPCLIFCFNLNAQDPAKDGYVRLMQEGYEKLVEENKESDLDGKYYIKYYNDGKLTKISRIEYDRGKRQGEWLHFQSFSEGDLDLATIENYNNGEKEGYYYNGDSSTDFSEEGYYKNDEKTGSWSITKNGALEKIEYRNGKKHGEYWRRDKSGVIVKGGYKNGEKTDDWTIEDLSAIASEGVEENNENMEVEEKTKTEDISTVKGKVLKPDNTSISLVAIKLTLNDSECIYAYTSFDGTFSMQVDKSKITENSQLEIVIDDYARKIISFQEFFQSNEIVLDKKGKLVTYEEYRSFYETIKSCSN